MWDIVLHGMYGVIRAYQLKGAASGGGFGSQHRSKVV